MKEKPQKNLKGSKKGKEKQDSPKEVELTPKQLKEKRREEARARAAETRKIVTAGIGQWTGKLPAQLLNEHAQKMKWERVEYPAKSFGREPDQQWVSSVVLARRNPKTKEVERIKIDPPADRISKQPTQVEARNMAATYAMHRVLSHRNMKMMLPPHHRDLWVQLDADKASSKPHEAYKWSEDPWQAQKAHAEDRQKFQVDMKEREERREHQRIVMEAQREASNNAAQGESAKETTTAPPTKRVKFNNVLSMSRKTRAIVEKVIRENNGFRFSSKDALSEKKHPEKYKQLVGMLKKLGFAEPFAREALEYSSSLSAALTWLLIHVPEDDIPKKFMPSDIGVTARVSSNMAVENTVSKLRSYGYSEELARNTAESFDGSLISSVVKLTNTFAGVETNPTEELKIADQDSIWPEEMESLPVVLEENRLEIRDQNSCSIVSRMAKIRVSFFKSPAYPNKIPGIAIEPLELGKVAKVAQLEATRQAAIYAESSLLGDFMLLILFQHIEETFAEILKQPPKLAEISAGTVGINESQRLAEEKRRAGKGARGDNATGKRRRNANFDPVEIKNARDKRMSTSDGRKMLAARESLPAWQKREEIVELIKKNRVTLITGETGSGKSTQTVQFLLDSVPDAQIVCTQPRRISAMGVAQRVADERLVSIGGQVGYVIRGEAKMSKDTQLRFVTSGVLLRMLQGNISDSDGDGEPDIDGITHVFVDEVHERSLDSDFLLILLKRLSEASPNIKIILMSATVDPSLFMSYFSPLSVGYAHITGRTFPVQQHFLGDVLRLTGYVPHTRLRDSAQLDDADETEEGGRSVGKIIGLIRANSPGRVDYDLIGATVEFVHKKLQKEGDNEGSILIFMSGAGEIDQALRAVLNTGIASNLWALPLHAGLPPNEQKKVFQRPPRGLRKVVASTNVAETSITIPDIVVVIDSGRVKETIYDPEVNVTRLVDNWTSKASATQRMGRAGRVRPGECYKLYTDNAQARMPDQPLPEILRSPLEVLYLNVKAMGVSSVEKFLSKAIEPPKQEALDKARQNLIAYGALDPLHDELTPLGKHISMIPTDPRTAKLLVLGAMLGCLPRALIIAAILSIGKIPLISSRNDDEGKKRLFDTFGGDNGDLIASCRAVEQYMDGQIDRSLVSTNVCREIQATRRQLLSSLVQIGFVESSVVKNNKVNFPDSLSRYDRDDFTIQAVIGAALQPNTAEIVFPQQKYVATSAGAVQHEGVDDARQIKFFNASSERVFMHPRSLLFGATSFANDARYLNYSSAIMTSKHFVTDVTPLSTYGLILFASRIGVDPLGNGIIIDKWTGLRCWPRAGILIQFLQQIFSSLMEVKFQNPSATFIDHPVITLVHDLIKFDGKLQEYKVQ